MQGKILFGSGDQDKSLKSNYFFQNHKEVALYRDIFFSFLVTLLIFYLQKYQLK